MKYVPLYEHGLPGSRDEHLLKSWLWTWSVYLVDCGWLHEASSLHSKLSGNDGWGLEVCAINQLEMKTAASYTGSDRDDVIITKPNALLKRQIKCLKKH